MKLYADAEAHNVVVMAIRIEYISICGKGIQKPKKRKKKKRKKLCVRDRVENAFLITHRMRSSVCSL